MTTTMIRWVSLERPPQTRCCRSTWCRCRCSCLAPRDRDPHVETPVFGWGDTKGWSSGLNLHSLDCPTSSGGCSLTSLCTMTVSHSNWRLALIQEPKLIQPDTLMVLSVVHGNDSTSTPASGIEHAGHSLDSGSEDDNQDSIDGFGTHTDIGTQII